MPMIYLIWYTHTCQWPLVNFTVHMHLQELEPVDQLLPPVSHVDISLGPRLWYDELGELSPDRLVHLLGQIGAQTQLSTQLHKLGSVPRLVHVVPVLEVIDEGVAFSLEEFRNRNLLLVAQLANVPDLFYNLCPVLRARLKIQN